MNPYIFIALLLSPVFIYSQKVEEYGENKMGQIERLKKINPSHGAVTPEFRSRYWASRVNQPSRSTNKWEALGPTSIISSAGIDFYVSGRVKSLEYINDTLIRMGAASGGIWEAKLKDGDTTLTNISDHMLPTLWMGAIATSPFDHNIIIAGTGEPALEYGAGVWRTEDGGKTWNEIPLPTFSGSFYDIQFSKVKDKVWMTGEGVYYSKDNGLTWEDKKRWIITGLAIDHFHPDTAMIGQLNTGVFRTYDGGKNWVKLGTNGDLPQEDVRDIKLANSPIDPKRVYAWITNANSSTKGLYRTDDFGDTWLKCNIIGDTGNDNPDLHIGMGWYCNYASVSPTNKDHVVVGSFWSAMSFDGLNFYGLSEPVHADMHRCAWSPDGSKFALATDGGVYMSEYKKPFKWNFALTKIPTLQFGSVAVSKVNPNIILGGTQDNGIIYLEKSNNRWEYYLGDGGGVATHPTNENIFFGTLGVFGDGLTFRNLYKENVSWFDNSFGLPDCDVWFRDVAATSYLDAPLLFTPINNKIYYGPGIFWLLYPEEFPCSSIQNISVTNESNPTILFNCLGADQFTGGYKIKFYEKESEVISYGLPIYLLPNGGNKTVPIFYTNTYPKQPRYMYALMLGTDERLEGQSIFKAEIANPDWVNITSNLPNVPYTSMLVNPINEDNIIVGTDGFGVFSTQDGGVTWDADDDGIPVAAVITDMDYQIVNDSVFCVMSTYGRGIFRKFLERFEGSSVNVSSIDFKSWVMDNQNLMIEGLDHEFNYKIFSISGVLEDSGALLSQEKSIISIANLSTGYYILKIENNYGSAAKSFVKY